jgi:hypothetical protein
MAICTISFTTAATATIPFGPFKDSTIDEIAKTDNGLLYLDRVRAKISFSSYFNICLEAYLDNPVIQKELSDLIIANGNRFGESK